MDRDTIIRLAREAGFIFWQEGDRKGKIDWACEYDEDLERFAALVAAHEREENLDIIEKMAQLYYEPLSQKLNQIADAIRNRT
jgi:hypothetical protein